MTAAGKDRNIKRPGELANVVKGEDRGRGPPDVAMGSAAGGERVLGLGQGPPPPPLSAGTNPKLSHYYVPVFSEHTTHNTHTLF